jgi:hypothetical protein
MAKLYAFTDIRKGVADDEGNLVRIVEYSAGEELKRGDFTQDELKSFVESGAVATYNRTAEVPDANDLLDLEAEVTAKDEEIRMLREQLAAAQGQTAQQAKVTANEPPKTPAAPKSE